MSLQQNSVSETTLEPTELTTKFAPKLKVPISTRIKNFIKKIDVDLLSKLQKEYSSVDDVARTSMASLDKYKRRVGVYIPSNQKEDIKAYQVREFNKADAFKVELDE